VSDSALVRLLAHRRGMIGAAAVLLMLAAGVLAPVAPSMAAQLRIGPVRSRGGRFTRSSLMAVS